MGYMGYMGGVWGGVGGGVWGRDGVVLVRIDGARKEEGARKQEGARKGDHLYHVAT